MIDAISFFPLYSDRRQRQCQAWNWVTETRLDYFICISLLGHTMARVRAGRRMWRGTGWNGSDGARPTVGDPFRVSEATTPQLGLCGVRYMLCATVRK